MNRFPAGVAISRQVPSETEPSPRARTAAGCGGVGLGPPASEGTLFISRQVFCVTGSDPARFGGSYLSEFAPVTLPPFSGVRPSRNPQAETDYIIWPFPHFLRSSPGMLPAGFGQPTKSHLRWVLGPANQNRAHSEQAPRKTGHYSYRLANFLLDAISPKGLLRAIFASADPSEHKRAPKCVHSPDD